MLPASMAKRPGAVPECRLALQVSGMQLHLPVLGVDKLSTVALGGLEHHVCEFEGEGGLRRYGCPPNSEPLLSGASGCFTMKTTEAVPVETCIRRTVSVWQ